ncbi:MAG: ATPase, T2SS/T4P/T4SS family [Isosphaeraceae bacterium]
MQRILIPTDFSEVTRDTIDKARELASTTRAELHVLHAAPNPGLSLPGGDEAERRAREFHDRLERAAQAAALDGLPVVCAVRQGRPWAEIVAYAREIKADLIVMGTRARSGLAYAVMGSVSEQVIRHAPCPVMIVRPAGEEVPIPEAEGGEADAGAGEAGHGDEDARSRSKTRAIRALVDNFGERLEGGRPDTWGRMVYALGRELDLEPPEAGRLLGDLEASGSIAYSGGYEAEREDEQSTPPGWSFGGRAGAPGGNTTEFQVLDGEEPAPSASIDLLQRALVLRATDIHIDPGQPGEYQVRLRIDGRLEPFCTLDAAVAVPLIQQFKVMASIDITEPFEPKEGRLDLPASLADVEVRLTSSPVQGGTAMALRTLRKDRIVMPLESLGLPEHARTALDRMLRSGDGLLLITGPTNAGKTTTIYSLLSHVSGGHGGRNLVSIEDPIEFPLPFIRQVGVDPRHNLTMARGLRTILRMDPDVVFVSEIRDAEAAEIAMRAASSGRFVFATLHTRDAASTVTALRDLRVDNESLGANLTGLISQRLARRLCQRCARRSAITPAEALAFRAEGVEPPEELNRPAGCDHCRGTGYFDRIGIFEAAIADPALSRAIADGAPEDDVRSMIREAGTPSLMGDALAKAAAGVTSFDEARTLKWA